MGKNHTKTHNKSIKNKKKRDKKNKAKRVHNSDQRNATQRPSERSSMPPPQTEQEYRRGDIKKPLRKGADLKQVPMSDESGDENLYVNTFSQHRGNQSEQSDEVSKKIASQTKNKTHSSKGAGGSDSASSRQFDNFIKSESVTNQGDTQREVGQEQMGMNNLEQLKPKQREKQTKHQIWADQYIVNCFQSVFQDYAIIANHGIQAYEWQSYKSKLIINEIQPILDFSQIPGLNESVQLIAQQSTAIPSVASPEELIVTNTTVRDKKNWYLLCEKEERGEFQKPYVYENQPRQFYMHEDSDEEKKTDTILRDLIEEEKQDGYSDSVNSLTPAAQKLRSDLNKIANAFMLEQGCPSIDLNKPVRSSSGVPQIPHIVVDIFSNSKVNNHSFQTLESTNCGALDFQDSTLINDVQGALTKIRNGIFSVFHQLGRYTVPEQFEFLNDPKIKYWNDLYNKVRLGIQCQDVCKHLEVTQTNSSCYNPVPIQQKRSRNAMDYFFQRKHFIDRRQFEEVCHSLQKKHAKRLGKKVSDKYVRAQEQQVFRQYAAGYASDGSKSTCHTYDTSASQFFKLSSTIESLNESMQVWDSFLRLDQGLTSSNSFLGTLANHGSTLITDPQQCNAMIALQTGKQSVELHNIESIPLNSVVQYNGRSEDKFNQIQEYYDEVFNESRSRAKMKKNENMPLVRSKALPIELRDYYKQRQIAFVEGTNSLSQIFDFTFEEHGVHDEETFTLYQTFAQEVFTTLFGKKEDVQHKLLIQLNFKAPANKPLTLEKFNEINKKYSFDMIFPPQHDIADEVQCIVGNVMLEIDENKKARLKYRFKNKRDTISTAQKETFSACQGIDLNFCSLGEVNKMRMDDQYKPVNKFADLIKLAREIQKSYKDQRQCKRDKELYEDFKELESIKFFVVVTDAICRINPKRQLMSAIHGLIDNNAEWCHVNLVKAQQSLLLTKYAQSIGSKQTKWGFGSQKVEQKQFKANDFKRLHEMISSDKKQISYGDYFTKSKVSYKLSEDVEINQSVKQTDQRSTKYEYATSFTLSVIEMIVDFCEDEVGQDDVRHSANSDALKAGNKQINQKLHSLVQPRTMDMQNKQLMTVDVLKFHHGKYWIDHVVYDKKDKPETFLSQRYIQLLPMVMINFRQLSRRPKTHDNPFIVVLAKDQWNLMITRIVQSCAMYIRSLSPPNVDSRDILNFQALQTFVIFNFCLLISVMPIYVPNTFDSVQIAKLEFLERGVVYDLFLTQVKYRLKRYNQKLYSSAFNLIRENRRTISTDYIPTLDILQKYVLNSNDIIFKTNSEFLNQLMNTKYNLYAFRASIVKSVTGDDQFHQKTGQMAHYQIKNVLQPFIYDFECRYNQQILDSLNDINVQSSGVSNISTPISSIPPPVSVNSNADQYLRKRLIKNQYANTFDANVPSNTQQLINQNKNLSQNQETNKIFVQRNENDQMQAQDQSHQQQSDDQQANYKTLSKLNQHNNAESVKNTKKSLGAGSQKNMIMPSKPLVVMLGSEPKSLKKVVAKVQKPIKSVEETYASGDGISEHEFDQTLNAIQDDVMIDTQSLLKFTKVSEIYEQHEQLKKRKHCNNCIMSPLEYCNECYPEPQKPRQSPDVQMFDDGQQIPKKVTQFEAEPPTYVNPSPSHSSKKSNQSKNSQSPSSKYSDSADNASISDQKPQVVKTAQRLFVVDLSDLGITGKDKPNEVTKLKNVSSRQTTLQMKPGPQPEQSNSVQTKHQQRNNPQINVDNQDVQLDASGKSKDNQTSITITESVSSASLVSQRRVNRQVRVDTQFFSTNEQHVNKITKEVADKQRTLDAVINQREVLRQQISKRNIVNYTQEQQNEIHAQIKENVKLALALNAQLSTRKRTLNHFKRLVEEEQKLQEQQRQQTHSNKRK